MRIDTDNRGGTTVVALTGDELATAIDAYLVARGVRVNGPRTVYANGQPCEDAKVVVDPQGTVSTWPPTYPAAFRPKGMELTVGPQAEITITPIYPPESGDDQEED